MTLASAAAVSLAFGAIPSGYYSTCENKGGKALLTALNAKVGPHTVVSYDGLWELYKTSDVKPNGKLWDMYSTKEWTPGREKCGNYKKVGDCVNREHSFPKSWFNDARPMYSDAFHLYPTDGKVNGQRSNFPYGECANGTTLPSNGSIDALGKLGTSTFAGYSGTVFEPVDEYKGDFARSYFYMAAAYNDKIAGWNSDMLAGNSYPCFSSWAMNLLLKWHRQDPVSSKEIDRNEAVYAEQKNRNPFIDHPEMVEYIWGTKTSEKWSSTASATPVLTLPVDGSTLDIGNCSVGVARTVPMTVKGSQLTGNVTLSASGAGLSVTPSTVSATAANSADGYTADVTFTPTATGSFSGSVTVSCGSLHSTVKVSTNAVQGLPASSPINVSDCSFVATWTYIGDADANGCYILYLYDAAGNILDTYPRSVIAAEEKELCDELEPETSYTYVLVTASGVRSNVISVTTAAPIPSIQMLYDGDLAFSAAPGEPSAAEEILLDVENITSDITISVAAPFELSSDKSAWAQSITVDPLEDRFYIRVNSDSEGTFSSNITATAGAYSTDDATVTATVGSGKSFFEDFEAGTCPSYNTNSAGELQGTMCLWELTNAGSFDNETAHSGTHAVRTDKTDKGTIRALADKKGGVGTVTLWAAGWGSSEHGTFSLEYSTDGGKTWSSAGEATTSGGAKEYSKYTFTVNKTGDVRLGIRQSTGKRLLFDDIEATDYKDSGIMGVESDYRSWTAYSLHGSLVVELTEAAEVAVHGVDGITYFRGSMSAGQNTLHLAPGLYIVAIADFTRRVVVK